MTQAALTCDHCQLPIPEGQLVLDETDGLRRQFCCHGGLGAFRIISGAGLERFYRQRTWLEPGVPEGVFEQRIDRDLAEAMVTVGPQHHEMHFYVEGIRCSSCVWINEKVLGSLPGVLGVRINYGSHRARLGFDPARISAEKILQAILRLGYRPHPLTSAALHRAEERERRSLLIRFGTAAFLSMQLMGYSLALYAGYFQGIDPAARQLIQGFACLVTTPVVFYAGWPFLAGAWRSLRNLSPGMDLLIAIGVLAAYGYSIFALFSGGEVYFDTAAMIVTLILLGRLLETAARRRAARGIDRLLRLTPEQVLLIDPDRGESTVGASQVQPGDRLLVKPGERFAVDGELVEGKTDIDESVISGEPLPVHRQAGDRVISGSLNLAASVILRATRRRDESFVARVAQLVEEAQARRAPVQALADRVAALFVPLVLVLALATFGGWLLAGATSTQALLTSIAVLVVACPCALGLATPTAILVASGRAAEEGILYRGGDILEAAGRITRLAFDKTGTLTLGRPAVVEVRPIDGSEADLLLLAATAEAGSNHPIARGILAELARRGLRVGRSDGVGTPADICTLAGRGLRLQIPRGDLAVGSRAFIGEVTGLELPDPAGPRTEVHVALNGAYRGCILVDDPLRPEAPRALRELQKLGLEISILTGDHLSSGERVAGLLGIQSVLATLAPGEKADWVRRQVATGAGVMMIGDGINDAPALAAADVGCAMAGGTDIALETSDLVLTRPDLGKLCDAIRLARRTLRIVRQNLGWAFAYNLVALPLAVCGRIAPVYAAVAMALSSICVVGNSLRLSRGAAAPPGGADA